MLAVRPEQQEGVAVGLVYCDLDETVRAQMLSEAQADIVSDSLYLSSRFSDAGASAYPSLLKAAIREGDESTLEGELSSHPYFVGEERVEGASGTYVKKVPWNAARTFAQGEFDRFYLRGLARVAIDAGIQLVVYRAKQVEDPRPESEALVGAGVSPAALLEDLRGSKGFEGFLGLGRPNSGLSARLAGPVPCIQEGGPDRPGCPGCARRANN